MVKGFESMLAGSLDLEEPWYITGAEFNPVKNEIDVHVGIRGNAVIACLAVVVRQNVTGMNPSSVHGAMLTACSIRAMFMVTAGIWVQKRRMMQFLSTTKNILSGIKSTSVRRS